MPPNQHLKNNLERKTCSKERLSSFLPNHGRPTDQLDKNWSSPLTRGQLRKVLGREPPRQSPQQVGSKAVCHFLENRRKRAKSVVSHQVVAIRHFQSHATGSSVRNDLLFHGAAPDPSLDNLAHLREPTSHITSLTRQRITAEASSQSSHPLRSPIIGDTRHDDELPEWCSPVQLRCCFCDHPSPLGKCHPSLLHRSTTGDASRTPLSSSSSPSITPSTRHAQKFEK